VRPYSFLFQGCRILDHVTSPCVSCADPDSVMRRLIAPRDRPAYLKAVTDMLVQSTELENETSLLLHVHTRIGPPLLCLVQVHRRCPPPPPPPQP